MAGRHGNKKITVDNLEIVEVLTENNQILIKGVCAWCKERIVSNY